MSSTYVMTAAPTGWPFDHLHPMRRTATEESLLLATTYTRTFPIWEWEETPEVRAALEKLHETTDG